MQAPRWLILEKNIFEYLLKLGENEWWLLLNAAQRHNELAVPHEADDTKQTLTIQTIYNESFINFYSKISFVVYILYSKKSTKKLLNYN